MAIQDWLDDLVAIFAIASHDGGTIATYPYYAGTPIPSAINEYPCSFVFPENLKPTMSAGLKQDIWVGRVEFHFFPDIGYDKLPEVMKYAARIRDAIGSTVTLNSKVLHISADEDRAEIEIPLKLRWDSDGAGWHWGAMWHWHVKEDVSNDYTVAA